MTQQEKDIELYKASLPAFFTNELEADKTILGLSVAAIGFFMALFLNKDIQITEVMFITIIIALVSFLTVSSMIIGIFIRNKKQLLHIVQTTGGVEEDTLLDILDRWKYLPFVIGIVCSIIFTLSLMYGKIHDKGTDLAKKSPKQSANIERVIAKAPERNTTAGVGGIVPANKGKPITPPTDSNKSGETDGK